MQITPDTIYQPDINVTAPREGVEYNRVRNGAGRTAEGEAITLLSNSVTYDEASAGTLSFVSLKADIDRDGRMDVIDIHAGPKGELSVSMSDQTLKLASEAARTLFTSIGTLTQADEISGQDLSNLLNQVRKDVGIIR